MRKTQPLKEEGSQKRCHLENVSRKMIESRSKKQQLHGSCGERPAFGKSKRTEGKKGNHWRRKISKTQKEGELLETSSYARISFRGSHRPGERKRLSEEEFYHGEVPTGSLNSGKAALPSKGFPGPVEKGRGAIPRKRKTYSEKRLLEGASSSRKGERGHPEKRLTFKSHRFSFFKEGRGATSQERGLSQMSATASLLEQEKSQFGAGKQ